MGMLPASSGHLNGASHRLRRDTENRVTTQNANERPVKLTFFSCGFFAARCKRNVSRSTNSISGCLHPARDSAIPNTTAVWKCVNQEGMGCTSEAKEVSNENNKARSGSGISNGADFPESRLPRPIQEYAATQA